MHFFGMMVWPLGFTSFTPFALLTVLLINSILSDKTVSKG